METKEIYIIAAMASDGGIGNKGELLFHLKEDMAWFRKNTLHNVVLMGRKTLESFPEGKPLPERTNVVLSRKKRESRDNLIWVSSVEEALQVVSRIPGKVFVIGGEEIYRQFLPLASKVYLTEISEISTADAYFPDLDADPEWEKTMEGEEQTYFDIPYTFVKYERVKK